LRLGAHHIRSPRPQYNLHAQRSTRPGVKAPAQKETTPPTMPWNDNANPGPWGAPPSGDDGKKKTDPPAPRRDGPRRPPPGQGPGGPDFETLLKRLTDYVDRHVRGPGGRGLRARALLAILAVAFVAWLGTGFYLVQANEAAVITRFGGFVGTADPGPHFHLPMPIEKAELVSVTNQNKTVIGGTPAALAPDESLMLTGDENIVDLSFTVQWHVSNAARYLFKVRDPDDAVKAVAESAMREVVGRSALKSILTNGRGEVQSQTATLMQKILDRYQAGVSIDAVQIQNANPPQEVVPAYQDIARAGQDAQSAINDANAYRNRVVNEAKGEAAKITQAGEGYKVQVVREAQGQAARFNQLYDQYRRAPAVTRQRLYIETMQQVLSHNHKVIVDAKGSSAPIILPPDAFRSAATGDAQSAPAAPAPAAPAAQAAPAPAQPETPR
jgi:membrane protease subunit HflK